jgi:chromosome segregation ATPase
MNMNKIKYFLIVILAATLFGCNNGKIKKLEEENTALIEQTAQKDSLLNDFMSAFNDFESNLELIKEKESLISMNSEDSEMRVNQKENILSDIQMINQLLDDNKAIISDLTSRLESSDAKLGEFRRMVSRLKKQLETKDTEITTLKDNLASMDFTIENLNRRIDTLNRATENLAAQTMEQSEQISEMDATIAEKDSAITEQIEKLNTGFFIAGTSKELKSKNIIVKKSLKQDFNEKVFTRIDISEINSIPVDSKKASLLTNHPSDSYVFNKDDNKIESLEITDPERFWKTSKYLVVVLN